MSLQVRCLVQLGEAVTCLLTKTDAAHKDRLTKHQRHWVGIEIQVKHLDLWWCYIIHIPRFWHGIQVRDCLGWVLLIRQINHSPRVKRKIGIRQSCCNLGT